jgi:hypothetical protein
LGALVYRAEADFFPDMAHNMMLEKDCAACG